MNSNSRIFERRWLIALLVFLAVLLAIFAGAYLGRIPTQLDAIPDYDKVGHFVLYGILAALLNLTIGHRRVSIGWLKLPIAVMLAIAFAIADEFFQKVSPLRSSDLTDLAADSIGILLFVWLSNRF